MASLSDGPRAAGPPILWSTWETESHSPAPKHMRFSVAKEIFDLHPDYVVGLVYVRDADVISALPVVTSALHEAAATVPSSLRGGRLGDHSTIKTWSESFSASGMNPKRYPPSVRALAERALRGDPIPGINVVTGVGQALFRALQGRRSSICVAQLQQLHRETDNPWRHRRTYE